MFNKDSQTNRPKPVMLAILDGWGIVQPYSGNAVSQANTPCMKELISKYPAMTIRASGEAVGLPWGKDGNSEVGHLNLGMGRIMYQDLPRINKSISDGSFYQNRALIDAIKHAKEKGGKLHIMGLTSNGGVHASLEHMQALLVLAKEQNVANVYVHAILDGRDTPYNSGLSYIKDMTRTFNEYGVGKIATLSGRFYTMDRDNHWDRIEKSYLAMTSGQGNKATDPLMAINDSYTKKIYDEEFVPTVMESDGKPVGLVEEGDSLIFFNFRPDRARQITKAFVLPSFDKFNRPAYLKDLFFVCFTEYEKDVPVEIVFPPELIKDTLGEIIANAGLKQLRIAETEKYAHVTYFFNGGRETKSEGETHDLVPSPPVPSYDMKPEMSAFEVTDKLIKAITDDTYDFILVNFANADMVGHTGNIRATSLACEAVDKCLARIVPAVLSKGGVILITADHGNAESKFNMQTGSISKEHTTNPVPFLIVGKEYEGRRIGSQDVPGGDLSLVQPQGILSDVAPTILKIMGLDKPELMSGRSLI
ncbi:2,3-bisphosphoglycerate-independent phosphoglycerate mutase [Candidatus Falkowbacteria bacterium]|nr:2,3-bisphosphoglycerate-independent phosphoglycerate mutase [Candidatus Falkowbacteria bacterium]